MKLQFTLALVTLSLVSFSQNVEEKELKTTIKEVTVFRDGAQVFESGNGIVPAGNAVLKIKNLSPFLDEKSIQVKGNGDFLILSVNHKFNYLNGLKKDKTIDSLKKLIEASALSISKEEARLDVLKEKQSLLNENKKLGYQNVGVTITQLKQTLDFYESEFSNYKKEEITIRKTIELKKREQEALRKQVNENYDQRIQPTSEIEIRTNAKTQVNSVITLTYVVSNAGWYPKYDLRVKNIKSPLELTYKAEVFQNTGVDWKNIKLKFSNGNPNQSGVLPELKTWNLNFARNTVFDGLNRTLEAIKTVKGKVTGERGQPLPGVNVVVKGSSIGTVTSTDGSYHLTLPNGATQLIFSYIGMNTQEVEINRPEISVQLQSDAIALSDALEEVVNVESRRNVAASPYARAANVQLKTFKNETMTTTFIENQTTVEIEVEIPYSIKSNGEKLLVDLKKYEIQGDYEYYAIPKLDKDAFLVARISNWGQYNLLEGEANLYFEDAFVGRSIIEATSLQDTLNVSLGRDRNISIEREKNEQFSKRKYVSGNLIETRGFKITVRNKKSLPIKLTLFDQTPVPVISDITVNPLEISKGQLDAKTGKIVWELNLDPQQQKEIQLQYEVKYPKKEKVILE